MIEDGKIIIEEEDDDFWTEKEKAKTVRVLSFSLGKESYGVHVTEIKEVLRVPRFTRVPNSPDFIVGVMNLRGEIISIVDLKYFLGLGGREITKESMIVVTDVRGALIGVLVDGIKDALDIEEAAIQPPLGMVKKEVAEYTKGEVQLGGTILTLIDFGKILSCREMEQLKKQ